MAGELLRQQTTQPRIEQTDSSNGDGSSNGNASNNGQQQQPASTGTTTMATLMPATAAMIWQ
jgi:hypothetical protein